jgi:hypothetical protein
LQRQQGVHYLYGFEGYGYYLLYEADDGLGVSWVVGVAAEAATGVFGDAVLVYDPFQGAAVAQAVVVDLRGMADRVREGL